MKRKERERGERKEEREGGESQKCKVLSGECSKEELGNGLMELHTPNKQDKGDKQGSKLLIPPFSNN